MSRGDAEQRVVRGHAPDVVDEVGARVERRLGDGRLRRVDADRHVRQRVAERGDDRHDAAHLLARVDGVVTRPRRLAADVEDVGAGRGHRSCPLDRAARPGPSLAPPGRPSASSPSPENESGVTLRMPITKVRSPQTNRRGPIVERARGPAGGAHAALTGAHRRVAEERVVDEQPPDEPDEVERAGDDHRPVRAPERRVEGRGRIRLTTVHELPGASRPPALRERRAPGARAARRAASR